MLLRQNLKTHAVQRLASFWLVMFVLACSNQIMAQNNGIISSASTQVFNAAAQSSPNSSVVLDFSLKTGESWDIKDDSSNVVAQCINGKTITGFEYLNVTIQTVGGSWFSEAGVYFSASDGGDDGNQGLKLRVGSGNESSGTMEFNSDGILDITDTGNNDVTSLADGQFIIQFFEEVDDVNDAIDARFTNGILKVWGVDLVPADCPFVASTPPPDLVINNTTTQGNNQVGDALGFQVLVGNNGGSAAQNIKLTANFSDNLTFLGLVCDDGTNTNDVNAIASLSVQNIDQGSTLNCNYKTEINATGNIDFNVAVSTDLEINVSDNNASFNLLFSDVAIPVNNSLALLLLALLMIYLVRKKRSIIA